MKYIKGNEDTQEYALNNPYSPCFNPKIRQIRIQEIAKITFDEFGVLYEDRDMINQNFFNTCIRRIIAFFAAKEKYTEEQIGNFLGKNHVTVNHLKRTYHCELLTKKPVVNGKRFKELAESVENKISEYKREN